MNKTKQKKLIHSAIYWRFRIGPLNKCTTLQIQIICSEQGWRIIIVNKFLEKKQKEKNVFVFGVLYVYLMKLSL